ncbi:hypothetical protein ICW40_20635 [Actinotalea ferrariae]|nr:hypothetical protein [Actinotalea ferrariae]
MTALAEADPGSSSAVETLRAALADAVEEQVRAGAAPTSWVLASADLEADAASRLRLRGAVLKAVR